ncbi:MAG: hypothetical protein QGH66_05740 [Dehalococcoidia bacterium]|jgi:hypothetical protein|nr:hypothetical protein [Dehalococcoidia bacterium]MDP7240090.1 hypothetical protein [Dehalococcoidia bacterium]MDP7470209.1 hypothetical protein [Dehalococcoidia bacterium]
METGYRTLLYEKDSETPNILYITLNRPEKCDAISIGPGEVKVGIFQGRGTSFSADFNLSIVHRVLWRAAGGEASTGHIAADRRRAAAGHAPGCA